MGHIGQMSRKRLINYDRYDFFDLSDLFDFAMASILKDGCILFI